MRNAIKLNNFIMSKIQELTLSGPKWIDVICVPLFIWNDILLFIQTKRNTKNRI